jgi:hypothetical protein
VRDRVGSVLQIHPQHKDKVDRNHNERKCCGVLSLWRFPIEQRSLHKRTAVLQTRHKSTWRCGVRPHVHTMDNDDKAPNIISAVVSSHGSWRKQWINMLRHGPNNE